MKKYLKIADVITGSVVNSGSTLMDETGLIAKVYGPYVYSTFVSHAINSHDELVDCAKYYEEESIYQRSEANRLQGALDAWMSIHDEDQAEMARLVAEVERLRDALQDAYLDGCHYGWEMSAEGYNAEHGGPNDGRLHNQFVESYSGESYTAA